MANDGPAHLLSLKVMRVSRPELAAAWQPFYSSSPSFSAHSSSAILSLQGSSPLPGHPKTLRDLTHVSELLTLPSAFGSIQLGETFSSCLCVNNESQTEVDVKQVKVEMQTVTTKVTLSEMAVGESGYTLKPGGTEENVVHHEIKELGQHVLACTVTYRLPPNARPVPGAAEDATDPSLLTFRKFYKFAVTNPLSVKTKVHAPRSPSALLSLEERDKIFLEIHIQNLTQEPMHFEKMRFECADGWDVDDVNSKGLDSSQSIFSGSLAIMQPQDTRQYIYILTPKSPSIAPQPLIPGSIIPLGRLDISWRSSFGEPGRLLTSMLTRRIPFLSAPQPASAVPPYLKRAISGSTPSRPQSPQSFQARPTSPPPPQRPGSPFQSRPGSISQAVRPQSPSPQTTTIVTGSDLEANLVVRHIPRNDIVVEKSFTVAFSLAVSSTMPLRESQRRKLVFAVQHLQRPKASAPAPAPPPVPEAFSPRQPSSGFSTPSSTTAAFNYALAHQKILDAAMRPPETESIVSTLTIEDPQPADVSVPILPPPYFEEHDDSRPSSDNVIFIGSSVLFLPPAQISSGEERGPSNPIVQDFFLTFVPLKKGFATIGGLRILLVEDKIISASRDGETGDTTPKQNRAHTLKEYDVVAEIWAAPC